MSKAKYKYRVVDGKHCVEDASGTLRFVRKGEIVEMTEDEANKHPGKFTPVLAQVEAETEAAEATGTDEAAAKAKADAEARAKAEAEAKAKAAQNNQNQSGKK